MDESNKKMKSFEKEWSEAFNQAEMAPSTQLWQNIDGALANTELRKYRRGVIFYRLLAAASIFVALSLGTILLFQNRSSEQEETLSNLNEDSDRPIEKGPFEKDKLLLSEGVPEGKQESGSSQISPDADDDDSKDNFETGETEGNIIIDNSLFAASSNDDENEMQNAPSIPKDDLGERASDKRLFSVVKFDIRSKLPGESSNSAPHTDIHLYNVPISTTEVIKNRPDNQLWAGLGFSSGNYNPNIGSNSRVDAAEASFGQADDLVANRAITQNEQNYDPGFSYSLALNGGWQLAPRWVLQSGLQYQSARSKTSTNTLIQNSVTQESIALNALDNRGFSANSLQAFDADLNLTNNYQFVSVPLKIGYIIVNKQFQLGLNTGVSTDFFLKNKVSEVNGLTDDFEQQPGNNSPFRRTFFSGLVGLEMGYRFLESYSFILEPTYRRSLSSLTNQSASVSSNPSSLGVTVGFRYTFK